jgi:hypothetical protein
LLAPSWRFNLDEFSLNNSLKSGSNFQETLHFERKGVGSRAPAGI